MKLHLPKRLLTALLAAFTLAAAPAALTLGSAAWGEDSATTVTGLSTPEFWGAEYTWIDGGWKNSAGQSVASPGRSDNGGPNGDNDDGPVLIFAEGVSANVTQGADTSDGGGIIVKEGADVTCSLGKWAGFVKVEEDASLVTSFTGYQKNLTSDGVQGTHATFYVDGTLILNQTTANFTDQGGTRQFHIGKNGFIDFSEVTTMGVSGTLNLELVVDSGVLNVTNRETSFSTTVTRKVMSSGLDLSSKFNNISVLATTLTEGEYVQLNAATESDSSGYTLTYADGGNKGVWVTYDRVTYTAEELQRGGDFTWTNTGTGWTKVGGDETDTSFINGDSVLFTANGKATVAEDIAVSSVTLSEGVNYEVALQSGKTFSVGSSDAALSLWNNENLAVTGSEGVLELYLDNNWQAAGDSRVILADGSNVGEVAVHGAFSYNLNAGAVTSNLRGADLRLENGAYCVVRNGVTDGTVLDANIGDVLIDGRAEMWVYGSANATVIDKVTGTGTLDKKDGGTVSFAGGIELGTLDASSGTVNISHSSTITTLYAGATLNLNEGVISVGTLRGSEQGAATINIDTGATLNITGTNNTQTTGASLLLAHWSYTSSLNLKGGNLNAEGATMKLSWDGTGKFNATSGVANLIGISARAHEGYKGEFNLGGASTGSARVNIGSGGIAYMQGSAAINLGGGTLGALADWELGYADGATGVYVNLISSGQGTYLDTLDANDGTTGRTVTFKNGLTGNGKLIKTGAGTLVLNGSANAAFTGTVELQEGNLTVKNAAVIGAGRLLIGGGNTVQVAEGSYQLTQGVLGSLGSGSTAKLAADLELGGGTLFFDTLNSDTAALTVTGAITLADAALVTVEWAGKGLSAEANTQYKVLAGASLAESAADSFVFGGSLGDVYIGNFTVADNTLLLTLTQRTNILTWNGTQESASWNETDATWQKDGTAATYTAGESVYFTNSAVNKNVQLASGVEVAPGAILITGEDYIFNGEGKIGGTTTLTVANGASVDIRTVNAYTGGTVIEAGGEITINNGSALGRPGRYTDARVLGTLSGEGTLVIDTSTAASPTEVAIKGSTAQNFTGTIDVQSGELYLGQFNNTTGRGEEVTLGAETINVREGASLWIHLGETGRSVNSDINLVSGSKLQNRDGNNVLNGDIRFNIVDPTAANPTYKNGAQDKVQLTLYWDKNMVLNGLLEGDGIVEMAAATQGGTGSWTLSNDNNTFKGSYDLVDASSGNKGLKLILDAENAARYATINLKGSSSVSTLQLNQSSVIKALNSTDADNIVTANGAEATLAVSSGTFKGKLQDGTGILSLEKVDDGLLELDGANNTYSGGTTILAGNLAVKNAASLGTGAVTLSGGNLIWNAAAATIQQVNVTASSDLTVYDLQNNVINPLRLSTVNISDGATLSINNNTSDVTINNNWHTSDSWKQYIHIDVLTGEGDLNVQGPGSTQHGQNTDHLSKLVIDSMAGFTGDITVTSREGETAASTDVFNVTLNTGAQGTTLGQVSIAGYGEQGEKSTATFNVQGDTTIGTLSAAGATVNILEGKTLTLGANLHTIGTLTMEADSQIVANFNASGKSLTVDKLNIEANSSVAIGTYSSSSTHKGLFNIDALTGTNSSLILKNGSQESKSTVFNLGSGQGSAFTGNIYIQADNQTGDTKRSVALNIKDATVAQGAVIHFLGKNRLTASNIGLGIVCDTEIAGISSGGTLNGTTYPAPATSTIVAGAIEADNDTHISNASSPISLTINVAEGADYTTSATIKDKLNLIKKGVGSQTFSGDVSAFNGTIDVQGGTLAFTDAAGWTTGISATVASGAELSLGNGTSNSTYNITALSSSGTVSLADNAILTLGNGVDASTHNIGTLNAGTGSKLNLAENAVLNAITSVTGSIALTGSGLYKLPTGAKTLTENVILDSNWTGTVAVQGVTSGGDNKNPIAPLLENLSNGTQSKVQLSNVQGWLSGASTNRHILLKNTDTSAALTLNDGTTTGGGVKTSEFAGSIGGSGDIVFNWSADSSNTTQRHLFSGDTSTWSGKFINQDCNTMTMMVEFSKSGNVFNSTVDGGGILNKNAQTTNSNKSGGKMLVKFNSSDTIDFYGTIGKEQGASGVDVEIAQHSVNFHKAIEVDSITVANNASATVISTLSTNSVQLGDTATITNAEVETATSMENVKLSEEGISSADETGDTKGTVSDAKVTLAALAEGTSFSIEDVTLSNVNIEAANAEDRVNLSGVNVSKGDASTVQLTKGEFHMMDQAQAQVGTGGTDINLPEGGPVNLNFTTSLMEGMTLGTDASLVVDLGDLSGFDGMSSGKPTFSITLAGFSIEGFNIGDFLSENPGIYFAADSWLGQLLVAQGASDYVKSDSLEAGAQATAGSGSGVSVSYNSTAVGTVIIISGLQVPEPASATLGLTALMMLCARRRRRA